MVAGWNEVRPRKGPTKCNAHTNRPGSETCIFSVFFNALNLQQAKDVGNTQRGAWEQGQWRLGRGQHTTPMSIAQIIAVAGSGTGSLTRLKAASRWGVKSVQVEKLVGVANVPRSTGRPETAAVASQKRPWTPGPVGGPSPMVKPNQSFWLAARATGCSNENVQRYSGATVLAVPICPVAIRLIC
jgi:hypothetical protein